MKDALDRATLELPSVAPAPPEAARTRVADRKRLAHYTPARQVDGCRNCRSLRVTLHGVGTDFEHETHNCARHRFTVQLGAICGDYLMCRRAQARSDTNR